MPTSYADAFRAHAKGHLDAQVYNSLHQKARGTAGGTALRRPAVREIRFAGGKFDREQVVEWLRQNNYNEAGLQPEGEGWLYQAHGGLPMQDETTRSLGPGITATVGRYTPEEGGKKGGVIDAVAKVFKSIISGAAADDAASAAGGAESAAHRVEYVAKADILPAYFDAAGVLAGQDYYTGIGHGVADARALGLDMIEKDAEAFDELRDEWTLGPPDLGGLDVHLGSGAARRMGCFGFDLVRKAGDHGTLIHDLNLGIPLPTGSARCVMVTKAFEALTEEPLALVREIRRVLMPGGRLLTSHGGPVLKASAGALVHVGGGDDGMQEYLRVEDASEFGDIVKALEGNPDFEMHQAGVSDAGAEALAGMPEERREAIAKALDPGRALPLVAASAHRQIVYCTVLEPDSFDAHGDTMTADDIEYTAHRYLTKSRVIGSGHRKAIQARPVESFVAPQDLFYETGPFGPQQVRKGSWVLGIHVEDPGEWQKVIDGEYTGVSIGGFGLREDLVAGH